MSKMTNSDKYSHILWLRKQRDCLIGAVGELVEEVTNEKIININFDELIMVARDLVKINDELYSLEFDIDDIVYDIIKNSDDDIIMVVNDRKPINIKIKI